MDHRHLEEEIYVAINKKEGKGKGKSKVVTVRAMKAYRVSIGVSPLILNLITR